MSETISLSVSDGIAVLTMARHPVNALDRASRAALVQLFEEISDRTDIRVAVLRSACRVFCAGADMRDRPDTSVPGEILAGNRLMRATLDTINECSKPVIACVNGAAIGAGFGLAAHCDIIVAAEEATFQMPEINVGLAGGATMLRGLLPRSKARRLFYTGRSISARELERLGVLDCVPASQLEDEVMNLAREIASKSAEAMGYAKQSANLAELMQPREAYRREQQFTTLLSRSASGRDAQAKFFQSVGDRASSGPSNIE